MWLLHHIAQIEADYSSEISVPVYEATRLHIPEKKYFT